MAEKELIMVTGLSGAGMSSALKVLEDNDYEVLDNFPLSMMVPLLENDTNKPIAIGVDTRTRNFDPQSLLDAAKTYKAYLIYIDCSENELQKRFNETRRKHPLAKDRTVLDGIQQEIDWLKALKDKADLVIDTTDLSVHDLRREVEGHVADNDNKSLNINITSFGYKNGLPRNADIVMDVRFLKNPHWDKELKPLTGLTKEVGEYIQTDDSFAPFFENFQSLIEPLLERYKAEGKHYLTIAIGCTGGKHRSVFTSEKLATWLKSLDQKVFIKHRDIPR